LHEFLLCFEIRVRIQSRHEIAIPLQEARCEHAVTQVRAQTFGDRYISQIGLFKDLPAHTRVLGENALQFDHQANFFIHDFENLISRSRHPLKIVRDDIRRTARHTRRNSRSGRLRYSLLGFLL
jgi:hypothetical protein